MEAIEPTAPANPPAETSQKTENANKPRKKRRRLPNFLRPPEAEALVAAAMAAEERAVTKAKKHAAGRDRLMIRLGLAGGFRVSELCNLQVPDIDLGERTATVLHGKGDKDRVVPLSEKLIPELAAWLGNRAAGHVFAGPGGRRLNPRTFQIRLRRLAAAAGIARRIHPHVLRHTCATMLLRKGANIRQVQTILGHESISTTERYTHVEVSELKGAVDRL